jgi:putative ABC transport system permease protein
LGIPLLRGREFTSADMSPNIPPVALATEATVRKYWPNENPVGKHVKPVFDKNWTTIVGVVGDVKEESLASQWPSWFDGQIYEPYGNGRRKLLPTEMSLVVRAEGDPTKHAGAIRSTVASLNPDVPVSDVKTMRSVVLESMAAPRSTMSLLAIFAGVALILGAIGIYGVISYSVAQRTSEIGIGTALGAQKHDVMRLVMGQGVRLAVAGVVIGIAGALGVTRLMSSLLYAVTATDPATFIVVALLLTLVALAASLVPARRAMRLDSIKALRYE